jgi:hypothetical protein
MEMRKLIFILLLVISDTSIADVEETHYPPWSKAESCSDPEICIRVFGSIATDDISKLQRIVSGRENSVLRLQVLLETTGGDVEASMRMGRIFRNLKAQAFPEKCASACVFLLAGATHRILTGKNVVIHRPYPSHTDKLEWSERQKQYSKWRSKLVSYLDEMDIPDSAGLVAEMEKVPPESGRLLSDSEMEHFLLIGTDPAMLEQEDMEDARHYGLTMVEFLRRKARVTDECGEDKVRNQQSMDIAVQCKFDIFEGLR